MFPPSIDAVQSLLSSQHYVADRGLATSIFLALKLQRPLLLEGEAGVGKTDVAKALASGLETELIRLQCYEGLDVSHAVYEWNYARQLLEIRLMEASGAGSRATDGRRAPNHPKMPLPSFASLYPSGRPSLMRMTPGSLTITWPP